MEKSDLVELRESIEAALQSGTPEDYASLAANLQAVIAKFDEDNPENRQTDAHLNQAIQAVEDAWQKGAAPADLPGDAAQKASLSLLIEDMLALQSFTLALSRGDLAQQLRSNGRMAGSLKALQASLRHLTWQTRRIAKGDFTQRIDFMGEFADSFNSMVASLDEAREQLECQKEELTQANARLRAEINERREAEEGRRLAEAHTEVHHYLMKMREQERVQIARNLHDGPIQELIGLNFGLQEAALLANSPAQLAKINEVQEALKHLIDDLRFFSGELRPPVLMKFGLEKAIRSYLDVFLEKHPGLRVDLVANQDIGTNEERITLPLYRICQEALNNVVRHSQATEVTITLVRKNGEAIMEVKDNGAGFSVPTDWVELARRGHLGLIGIQERAEAAGGWVEILSTAGDGTRLITGIPIQDNGNPKN
ncbi:MAG: histidine kinase [Chloroflexi bacterium]|nr:histidine kinase [Chloroflexota bacterium]